MLKRLGWVADENIQLTGLPPSQGGLTTREVESMVNSGWELDTQGISHADLITLDAVRSSLPDRDRPPDDPAPLRGARQLVLLSIRPLRRDGDRRRKAAGFVGSTTVVPGWAGPPRTPSPTAAARARRHEPPSLLQQIADARAAAGATGLLRRRREA